MALLSVLLGLSPSRPILRLRSVRTASAAATASPTALVQHIYQRACAQDLDGACAAMADLTPESVGLARPGPKRPRRGAGPPRISYMHVYADAALSIGIFVLPAGASIPLHDHPGMSVLSQLLYGSLHVTSYDAGEPLAAGGGGPGALLGRLAGRQTGERRMRCAPPTERVVRAPAPPLRLDPTCGNIHEFVALEETSCWPPPPHPTAARGALTAARPIWPQDTAVFDVLTPPYNDFAGRSCHYYSAAAQEDNAVELREVPWPSGLVIASAPYRGPPCGPEVSSY